MPAEVVSNIYLNYGMFGLIVIAFFVLIIWTVKNAEKREEKLHGIIETLSNELPEIRNTLHRIEDRIGR